jgi:hypothetical protein
MYVHEFAAGNSIADPSAENLSGPESVIEGAQHAALHFFVPHQSGSNIFFFFLYIDREK